MGKKVSVLSYLYLIGMALVAIGFCCPMVKVMGISFTGFDFIKNAKEGGFVCIGSILIIAGALAGLAASVVKPISGLKLIFLLVSIAGGVVLVIGFYTGNAAYKLVGKHLLKSATYGLYLVVAGWIVALCGKFLSK